MKRLFKITIYSLGWIIAAYAYHHANKPIFTAISIVISACILLDYINEDKI